MGLFSKLFGYRWSIYFRNDGAIYYAMHEHSIIRMIGYVLPYYQKHGEPKPPWDLVINFNKKHDWLKLRNDHFTAEDPGLTSNLLAEIARIDPGYRVGGGEPVFENASTKKEIPIFGSRYSSFNDYVNNLAKDIVNDIGKERPEETTFYTIMKEIFET